MTHQPYSAYPSPIHDSVGNTLTSLADWEIPGDTAMNYHHQQFLAAEAPQWLRQGLAHLRQGQYNSALALLQQALEAYRSLADQEREAKVLLILATLYYRVADYLWATDYGRQCLKVAQTIQHTELTQRSLEHLGNSYRHLKRLYKKPWNTWAKVWPWPKPLEIATARCGPSTTWLWSYRAKGLSRQAATPLRSRRHSGKTAWGLPCLLTDFAKFRQHLPCPSRL